jgi:hypothetical protein
MITLNHTVNVKVNFDETKAPAYILSALQNLPADEIQKILATTFIASLDSLDSLDKINENNAYALVEWGDN